jgi:hypothetical protein
MEMTHANVQGPNNCPPPRSPKPVTLALHQVWNQGLPPETRQQVLQILSLAAARHAQADSNKLTTPLDNKEANDE